MCGMFLLMRNSRYTSDRTKIKNDNESLEAVWKVSGHQIMLIKKINHLAEVTNLFVHFCFK